LEYELAIRRPRGGKNSAKKKGNQVLRHVMGEVREEKSFPLRIRLSKQGIRGAKEEKMADQKAEKRGRS